MNNRLVNSWQLAVNRKRQTQAAKHEAFYKTSFWKKMNVKCGAVVMAFLAFVNTSLAQADSMMNQQAPAVDMATTMRSNGKIYVVVAVLTIILLGLFTYVIRLDRKITRLEKSTKND